MKQLRSFQAESTAIFSDVVVVEAILILHFINVAGDDHPALARTFSSAKKRSACVTLFDLSLVVPIAIQPRHLSRPKSGRVDQGMPCFDSRNPT